MPRAVLISLLLVVPAANSFGQRPLPHFTSVFPAGGKSGESVEITVVGTALEGVTSLWFDHPGLRAFYLKGQTFRVAIGPETPLGQHDVRLIGPFGVSNPRTFVVGSRPEMIETEPNDTLISAQRIDLNLTVNGKITPTDVDAFRFDGKKGQRILIVVEGDELDSKLDGTLKLTHADGRLVSESRDINGKDPFLDVVLPADGPYVASLHDVIYGGSKDHVYRLAIHDGPHIESISPLSAIPGMPTEFILLGQNLGGELDPASTVDGKPLERVKLTYTIPKDANLDQNSPRTQLNLFQANRRGINYEHKTPRGLSNPVFILEASSAPTLELEPNDGESVQEVTLPADISATFGRKDDFDVYRFPAKKGETIYIEAFAERIGSPAAPRILVQKLDAKGNPTDLNPTLETRTAVSVHAQSVAEFDETHKLTIPDDGVYQVLVYDQFGTARGDLRLFYRLSIRYPIPDINAIALPSETGPSGAFVQVRRGGRTAVDVHLHRMDGYDGVVVLEAVELPDGLTARPMFMNRKTTFKSFLIESSPDTCEFIFPIKLRAKFKQTPETPELVREVVSGGYVTPIALTPQQLTQGNSIPIPARVTRGTVGEVLDRAKFALKLISDRAILAQNSQVRIPITLERCEGFDEPVTLNGLNGYVIPKGKNEGLAIFNSNKDAPLGQYEFVVRGSGEVMVEKDTTLKDKVKTIWLEYSPSFQVDSRKSMVEVAPEIPKEPAQPGSEVKLSIKIKRINGYQGPVRISLAPDIDLKAKADEITITPDKDSETLTIKFDSDIPDSVQKPGSPITPFALRAITVDGNEQVIFDLPIALTVKKK